MANILLLSRKESYLEILPLLQSFGNVDYLLEQKIEQSILSKKYDICISYCYGPILKKTEIEILNCKILNLHPSFLPYGKGIYPILWAAYENLPFGASIHEINHKIDSGPIYVQEKIDIDPEMNLEQARFLLFDAAKVLLSKNLIKIMNNDLKPIRQIEDNNKYYRNRKESMELLNKFNDRFKTTINEIYKLGIQNRKI